MNPLLSPNRNTASPFLSGGGRFLLLWALAMAIYWPGLDNGFISDDYVFLERVETLATNPLYLFEIPPENFRTTTYLAFLALKKLFGYQSWAFYLFTITLHALNAFLLNRLVHRITQDPGLALMTAVLFVGFQNPQEAVLWLGGMHEAWQGLFVLATLLAWVEGRRVLSLLFYGLALFCKESAAVVLLLIPVVEFWWTGRFRFRREYLWHVLLSAVFAAGFAALLARNSLVAGGFYAFGPKAAWVFVNSLHRLAFPWIYLLGAVAAATRAGISVQSLLGPLAWMGAALAPYIFLTYQNHVPSRHEYLASMGAAGLMGMLLNGLHRRGWKPALMGLFIVVNAGYIALIKDRQFENRAAPTTQLVKELQTRPPTDLRLLNYPFNPWTAKLTSRLVEGWSPAMIDVGAPAEACPDCLILRWDPESRRYRME